MRKIILSLLLFGGIIMLLCGACGNGGAKQGEFDFGEVPAGKIEEAYEKCAVVYDSYGRQYEVRAAQQFADFFNRGKEDSPFAQAIDQDDFEGEASGVLTVYVGAVECESAAVVWEAFGKEGYAIYCDRDKIVVRGSNAENTYYAASRMMQKFLYGNPDVLTNAETGKAYAEYREITREDYIEDISAFPAVWEYEWTPPSWLFGFEQKLEDLVAKDGRPMAFAHRGDLEAYPENSIEAIISAVRKGADAIEIDCAMTADGILVLNHGEELNPTTDWMSKRGKPVNGIRLPESNRVIDWTYEQLCQLNLRAGNGNYSDSGSEISGYRIATLKEAFRVANERCFLSVDRLHCDLSTGDPWPEEKMGVNNPYWPNVHAIIEELGAPRCMLYANLGMNAEDTDALRKIIEAEFGVKSPTLFDRAGWHNTVIDWYAEFDLVTDAEFDAYYDESYQIGSYIMGNRLSKIIEWLDKYHAPAN